MVKVLEIVDDVYTCGLSYSNWSFGKKLVLLREKERERKRIIEITHEVDRKIEKTCCR